MAENWWNPLAWDAPFPVVVAALFVVVVSRAGATYAVGRFAATGSRRTRAGDVMTRPGFASAVERINRLGAPVVTLSFLTVGVQTVVNFSAGFLQMPLRRFVGFSALALAWRQHPAIAIALVLLVVAALLVALRRRPSQRA